MSTVIRAATPGDQRLITSLVRGARLNPTGLSWPNFLIAQQIDTVAAPAIRADRPARIVGIGQLRPHRDGNLELASLVVVPEAQGRGVGSQLVEALIHKADRPLYLMCERSKVTYYERFGFSEMTDPAAMPRAMRRIYRLARAVSRVAGLFTKLWLRPPQGLAEPRLAIMAHTDTGPA